MRHPAPLGKSDVEKSRRIFISIPSQTLHLFTPGAAPLTFPISSSRFGLGFEPGSFRTPTGRFRIAEKIGHDHPPGAVFRARKPTGEIASQGGDEDKILTRILWLDGLDPDNANTRDRYIYIHGTNQEHLIGTPASHGCIRMRNDDIIALFDLVDVGDPVEISPTT